MTSDQQKFTCTYIQSITPGLKNVNLQFIVLEVGNPRHTKDGQEVRTLKVADTSGSVDLAVWNELGECLAPGDICRLRNGYSLVRKGSLSISCGKAAELTKIGEFTMVYSETPNISEYSPALVAPETNSSKKRSPPRNDEDNNGEDRDSRGFSGNGPQIKHQKKIGNNFSSSSISGSNGYSTTGRAASKLDPAPFTKNKTMDAKKSVLAESVPSTSNDEDQKGGYRRLESWKKTETYNAAQNFAIHESPTIQNSCGSTNNTPSVASIGFNPFSIPPPPGFVLPFRPPVPPFPLMAPGPNGVRGSFVPRVRGGVF